jgi:ankyrin repeat domain-containing protein 50
MLQSAIDNVDLDRFLPVLSVVDQEKHQSKIPSLNYDQPKWFWIFRNMDFRQWSTASCPQVLWLSGPPECDIHQVSSYIVDQEKNRTSKTQYFVLYFFCSTAARKEPIIVIFIHTLLNQIVRCSPANKRILIVRRFLHSLLEGAFKNGRTPNWESRDFNERDSPDANIKKILKAPANELWAALEAVLGDDEQRGLSVVVDGLDKVEHRRGELIGGVCAFVKHLQQRTSRVKILLTSRPLAEIKDLFDGLPCIEHDRERKGSSAPCPDSKLD